MKRTSTSLRLSRTSSLFFSSLLVFAAAVFARPVFAQFNGPALPPGTSINRPVSPTTDPAILFPSDRDVHLGPGDLVSVRVFGPGDYLSSVRIGTDGKVQLPLIGIITLKGLTTTQAEQLIADRLLAGGMYRDPQVTVQLTEGPNASASIIGEVHSVVPIVGQRRLLDVLAFGGGLPATASHVLTIDRVGAKEPIVIDLGTDPARSGFANIPIFPGDTIVISRVGVVYVLGAFKTQGSVPVVGNSPLTLLQVAALSGGPDFEGRFDDLRIIRTVGTQRTLVRVNIKKIMNGKDPDPVLQADDILFLPDNTLKAALKNGGIGILFSTVSLFISLIAFR